MSSPSKLPPDRRQMTGRRAIVDCMARDIIAVRRRLCADHDVDLTECGWSPAQVTAHAAAAHQRAASRAAA